MSDPQSNAGNATIKQPLEDRRPERMKATLDIKPHKYISLSVLTWTGQPTTMCGDGDDLERYVGCYDEATHTSSWTLSGWGEKYEAYRYSCRVPITWKYDRDAFIDVAGSSDIYYGGIIDTLDLHPILRIFKVGGNAWPETFKSSSAVSAVRHFLTMDDLF